MTENPELNKLIDAINGGEQIFSQIGGNHLQKVAHHLVKKGFKKKE